MATSSGSIWEASSGLLQNDTQLVKTCSCE